MRIVSILLSVVFLSYLLTFSGCYRSCFSEDRFVAVVHFANESQYTSVYGWDGEQPGKEIQISDFSTEVPLTRKQNKTVLIFQSDTRKDTLSIQYELTPKLQSRECGFYLDADHYQVGKPTTFSNVELQSPSSSQITVYIND